MDTQDGFISSLLYYQAGSILTLSFVGPQLYVGQRLILTWLRLRLVKVTGSKNRPATKNVTGLCFRDIIMIPSPFLSDISDRNVSSSLECSN